MEVGICKKLREAILSIVVDIFYTVVILRASIQLNKRLFEACGWLGTGEALRRQIYVSVDSTSHISGLVLSVENY